MRPGYGFVLAIQKQEDWCIIDATVNFRRFVWYIFGRVPKAQWTLLISVSAGAHSDKEKLANVPINFVESKKVIVRSIIDHNRKLIATKNPVLNRAKAL